MYVLLNVCLCIICVPTVHGGQKRVDRSPGTEVIDNFEPLYGCWIKPGPLGEQQMLLPIKPTIYPLTV